MKKIYSLIVVLLMLSVASSAQVNSLYHLKNVTTRHEFNPAFQPHSNWYLDLPIFPSLNVSVGNNSLTLSDVFYPRTIDGKKQMVSFLHPEAGNIDEFYNSLKSTTRVHSEFDMNILSFGFRIKQSYITVGVAQRFSLGAYIPKDFFRFGLYGTTDTINVNTFDFKKLSVQSNMYTEVALGYSHNITENLTVGGKAKFLIGQANISMDADRLRLDASRDEWLMNIDANLNATVPFAEYILDEEGKLDDLDFQDNLDDNDYLELLTKSPGKGLAFDLGVSWKLFDNHLTLSGSVVDLGFIKWKKNTVNVPVDGNFSFTGIEFDTDKEDNGFNEDYFKNILDSIDYTTSFNSYTTGLATKVFLAAEYSILNEKISFGVLSKNTFVNDGILSELTTSANFFPVEWFNASVSYSWLQGRGSNIGVALGGRVGPINMYIAGDYFPFHYTSEFIPHKTKTFNLQMGLLLAFGNKSKKDELE